MKIGNVEIFLVPDGHARTDGGGMFGLVPKLMWESKYPSDEQNRVAMKINSLLVKDGDHNIVVDTGYGSKSSHRVREIMGIIETGQLPERLRERGVDPAHVDLVINTHLHFDHAGGNTIKNSERAVPAFPNATYVVQRGEWEDANNPNERTRATYLPENFRPLGDTGRLELIEGDTQITPHVRCLLTPGHTPSHQSVLIESDGQKALYVADLAPFTIHMERLPWIASYDLDVTRTLDTRREIQRWVAEEHVLLIFPHDPEVSMGYLRAASGRFWVDPVE